MLGHALDGTRTVHRPAKTGRCTVGEVTWCARGDSNPHVLWTLRPKRSASAVPPLARHGHNTSRGRLFPTEGEAASPGPGRCLGVEVGAQKPDVVGSRIVGISVDVVDVEDQRLAVPMWLRAATLAFVWATGLDESPTQQMRFGSWRACRCLDQDRGPVPLHHRPTLYGRAAGEVGRIDTECPDPAGQMRVMSSVGFETEVPHDVGEVDAAANCLFKHLLRVLDRSCHRVPASASMLDSAGAASRARMGRLCRILLPQVGVWLWQLGHRKRRFSGRESFGLPSMWSTCSASGDFRHSGPVPQFSHLCDRPDSMSARLRRAASLRLEPAGETVSTSTSAGGSGAVSPSGGPYPGSGTCRFHRA